MKVARMLALPFAVAFAITPIAYSEDPIHTRSSWALSEWFNPLHTSTWFMSDAQYCALYNLRAQLLGYVRKGDIEAVKALLISDVKEFVDMSNGTAVTILLEAPVRIESFDATLPLAIEEAVELGFPDIVQALCDHAKVSSGDTAIYVDASRDREGVARKLYAQVADKASKAAEGAEKVADKVVEGAKKAYHSAEKAVKNAVN